MGWDFVRVGNSATSKSKAANISTSQMQKMVVDYYNTQSEWKSIFTMDRIQSWRIEDLDPVRKRGFVQYRYVPVPSNRMDRLDTGVDQRIFDFSLSSDGWLVTNISATIGD